MSAGASKSARALTMSWVLFLCRLQKTDWGVPALTFSCVVLVWAKTSKLRQIYAPLSFQLGVLCHCGANACIMVGKICWPLALRDSLDDISYWLCHVSVLSRWYLKVLAHAVLNNERQAVWCKHPTFVSEIRFISNQHPKDVFFALLIYNVVEFNQTFSSIIDVIG